MKKIQSHGAKKERTPPPNKVLSLLIFCCISLQITSSCLKISDSVLQNMILSAWTGYVQSYMILFKSFYRSIYRLTISQGDLPKSPILNFHLTLCFLQHLVITVILVVHLPLLVEVTYSLLDYKTVRVGCVLSYFHLVVPASPRSSSQASQQVASLYPRKQTLGWSLEQRIFIKECPRVQYSRK